MSLPVCTSGLDILHRHFRMVNITDMDDIEEQLKNLDKVNSIINGMKNESLSEAERKQFMKQADNLIKETEDRTVIK